MTGGFNDHTREVEQRISAIKVRQRDICAFYQPRDLCLVAMKECWYCRFAFFDMESKELSKEGFCKFRMI